MSYKLRDITGNKGINIRMARSKKLIFILSKEKGTPKI